VKEIVQRAVVPRIADAEAPDRGEKAVICATMSRASVPVTAGRTAPLCRVDNLLGSTMPAATMTMPVSKGSPYPPCHGSPIGGTLTPVAVMGRPTAMAARREG
jgi:hypothetical protein